MRRFAKVLWNNAERWVEFLDDTQVVLIAGMPALEETQHERFLKGSEIQTLVYLAPFFGTKVLGLAYNYKSLIGFREQYDEPLFFLKSPTSPCGHRSAITYPPFAEDVWVEVELTILIKKECRSVSVDEAADYILGVTVGSDMTAQNICGRDHHLARSKALDQFAPMGPFLVTGLDTSDLKMTTRINGEVYQSGATSDRVLNDAECVSLISEYVTLQAGDAILTGTPAGAMSSLVKPGDVVTHWIEQIGKLQYDIV